jgi:hypothetical protein
LTEVDESIVAADPMSNWMPLYLTETIKHYYLNGVGEVCNENQTLADWFDFAKFTANWYGQGNFWSWNQLSGSAIAWYIGADTNWDSYYSDTYTYITATTLRAVQTQLSVRNRAQVATTAAAALSAATYAASHSPLTLRGYLGPAQKRFTWPRP